MTETAHGLEARATATEMMVGLASILLLATWHVLLIALAALCAGIAGAWFCFRRQLRKQERATTSANGVLRQPDSVRADPQSLWFCAPDGLTVGPYSFEQLQAMAAAGHLSLGDLICRKEDQRWMEARCVVGLFQ